MDGGSRGIMRERKTENKNENEIKSRDSGERDRKTYREAGR